MAGGGSLEGWAPEIRDAATLAEVIDRAFDYRGDVTLRLVDGTEVVGYLSNRDRDAPVPCVQVLDPSGGAPQTIPYARIRTITFSGKDTAAGNSYAAWIKSRDAARASKGA